MLCFKLILQRGFISSPENIWPHRGYMTRLVWVFVEEIPFF